MDVTILPTTTREEPTLAWHEFRSGLWNKEINVRDFIQTNALSDVNLTVDEHGHRTEHVELDLVAGFVHEGPIAFARAGSRP